MRKSEKQRRRTMLYRLIFAMLDSFESYFSTPEQHMRYNGTLGDWS